MFDYDEILSKAPVLTFEEAKKAHQHILSSVDGAGKDARELYNDLVNACISYANIRAVWSISTNKVRNDTDLKRTRKHDAVINNVDILERYLKQRNMDTGWRKIIGKERFGQERKRQGDFACYVAYICGLTAR
ncbi:hypothetical protein [Companilactobacillus jidongensis]|uniref:hypothetical protein n=1 Tax=Companilactobacillus jidongensis TaxID=2486006 RepID=UPI000F7805E4|nr:hypothetical protein [Companilactobacillus jidongensis]